MTGLTKRAVKGIYKMVPGLMTEMNNIKFDLQILVNNYCEMLERLHNCKAMDDIEYEKEKANIQKFQENRIDTFMLEK